MNFKRAYFYTLIVILFTTIGFAAGYFVKSLASDNLAKMTVLNQAYNILQSHGWKSLPEAPALEYGMIRGMVQAYNDPYTVFVEPVEHELQSNTLQGSFGGSGVRLGRDSDGNFVLFPFPDSPAEKAGVLDGDRLLAVDGTPVTPDTPTETVQAALRGPVGEWVEVEISRPPDFKKLKLKIKRAEIPLPSVTWHIDPDESNLGVIEVNVIASSTPDEILSAVEDLSQRGAKVFILDLRDNYGGLLTAGVDTARLFLKDGEVIQQQYRNQDIETFRVEKPGALRDIPLAVLVNQNTASAAEIIAGSLQANKRAELIGTPTYGKDTIQLVFDLSDSSSLHVTAAKWWIPGLEQTLAGGLQPDIPIEMIDTNGPDLMIQAAIQSLLGRNTTLMSNNPKNYPPRSANFSSYYTDPKSPSLTTPGTQPPAQMKARRRRSGCSRIGCSILFLFAIPLLLFLALYLLAPLRTNVLVLGIDYTPPGSAVGRSDTNILVSINPLKPTITMLSIPRDLWVPIPGYGEESDQHSPLLCGG